MSGIWGLELPPSLHAHGLCTPQKPFQPSTMWQHGITRGRILPWHFNCPLVLGVWEEGYMDPCIDVWRPESAPASPSIILHLFWSHWIWTWPTGKTACQSQASSCLCFLACPLHRYQRTWRFTLGLGIWTQDLMLLPPQPAFCFWNISKKNCSALSPLTFFPGKEER